MPFIGRDWRSPGEVWIKTDEGWERMKLLQNSAFLRNQTHEQGFPSSGDSSTDSDSEDENNENSSSRETIAEIIQRLQKSSSQPIPEAILKDSTNANMAEWQPYCQVTLKHTKEVAGYNTISEAFHKLDFCNAIRDIRRFNYISKLLHLLITQNLTSLSGCATKVLFTMLEELAWQVASNQQNIHILQTLLYDLKKIMKKYYCWGRPQGSTRLWEQHLKTMERICNMANTIQIKEPAEDGSKRLTDLPEEIIREILLRLTDYKDLMSSGQSYDIMQSLLDEEHIWRQLCKYHYTKPQMRWLFANSTNIYTNNGKVDWERVFHQLRKKFGLKEEYADCLFLCRHCRCLFWKSYGHPCVYQNRVPLPGVKQQTTRNEAQNPVVVHNMPFFHHPLVLHYNNNNQQNNNRLDNDSDDSLKVPLHVPVPPQAFLKFFSL
ncbi:F-box only protein 32-like [Oppia nitens]|uniref:F-box only protein 32-like n=1 Tax=Oppia nitens TaxID=1686743 RepID=UPI0023DB8711|nr:F-box only protein 32-like [Oppia nitens]